MLTDYQRILFTELVDVNWEFNQETNNTKKFELFEKLNALKSQLMESMGTEAYEEFFNKGRQMFQPL